MNYEFPRINHIDEVIEAIDGVNGFIVAPREFGNVVNYVMMGPDIFPDVKTAGGSAKMREKASRIKAIRRECRGLIFNHDGLLISRPLHKFFNVGERDETRVDVIDLNAAHVVMDKLDGSMIRNIPMDHGYRLGTKMGITDVALQAEVFVAKHANIDAFIRHVMTFNHTAIFEWCSRSQTIVIDYPVDKLVLLALREINTGEYGDYHQMADLAKQYNIDVVAQYPHGMTSAQQLVDHARVLKGQEGWVVRWSNGHMAKIKADEYVTIHRAKDHLMREKGLLENILNETLDDIKPFLPVDDLHRLENYERSFWKGIETTALDWKNNYNHVRSIYGVDRKKFALNEAANIDPYLRAAIFKMWDHEGPIDFIDLVKKVVQQNLSSQTKIDEVRGMFATAKWDPRTVNE